jgi:hypothetical protein
MSADQNHHYLPQSYQRGWAGADGRVHVYRWRHDRLVCDAKPTKSTGGRDGLYYIPMAPPEQRNFMEDVFWKMIDQWGADGLQALRDGGSANAPPLKLEQLAIWLLSLETRNPRKIAWIEAEARQHVLELCDQLGYDGYRSAHHPATLEAFQVALTQPGLTELGARSLREMVLNAPVRKKLMVMDWQVVTLSNAEPLLTSDVPLIRYKGLKDDDGLMLLALSPTEFLAIFNRGSIDMKAWIQASIESGDFVSGMNKFVVRHKIDYAYAQDASQMDFVRRYWAVSETPSS